MHLWNYAYCQSGRVCACVTVGRAGWPRGCSIMLYVMYVKRREGGKRAVSRLARSGVQIGERRSFWGSVMLCLGWQGSLAKSQIANGVYYYSTTVLWTMLNAQWNTYPTSYLPTEYCAVYAHVNHHVMVHASLRGGSDGGGGDGAAATPTALGGRAALISSRATRGEGFPSRMRRATGGVGAAGGGVG